MAWRKSRKNVKICKVILGSAIFCCCLILIFIASTSLPNTTNRRDDKKDKLKQPMDEGVHSGPGHVNNDAAAAVSHRLGVIVPFRDRFDELLSFAPFIHNFLNQKKIIHEIVVVNQVDKYRFNRASLINVGFKYVTSPERSPVCDYIAMHDVDLLPLNSDLPYDYPSEGTVTHVAAPGLHPKYNYSSFIGGILIVPTTVFHDVNGLSNLYWGWGLEDDEFYVRLKQNNIKVVRPTGIQTGHKNTFKHIHSSRLRPRDHAKCYDQFNKTRRRDRLTGLRNVNYTLKSVTRLTIEDVPLTVLNVQLHCNTHISPWCDCTTTRKTTTTISTTNQKDSTKKAKS